MINDLLWFLSLKINKLRVRRPVAQLAERRSPKPKVGGSMPSWPAILLVEIDKASTLGNLVA